MTTKKCYDEKYRVVLVSYRPDQDRIVKTLQSKRMLSTVFQDALDEYGEI